MNPRIEVEHSVMGDIIEGGRDVLQRINGDLDTGALVSLRARTVLTSARRLLDADQDIDFVSVKADLESHGELESVGHPFDDLQPVYRITLRRIGKQQTMALVRTAAHAAPELV